MATLGEQIKSADWKAEKHVPAIECPDAVTAGEVFDVKVSLGKEVAHPNTTEHFIAWIELYFQAEGDKFIHSIGRFEFAAHGESPAGANQGPVYTHHSVTASMKTTKPGTLHALSYCNIHGLWESSKEISLK